MLNPFSYMPEDDDTVQIMDLETKLNFWYTHDKESRLSILEIKYLT